MPSHFSTIGMPVHDRPELVALIQRVSELAAVLETKQGQYLRWSDPSGAELWIQVDAHDTLIGVTPHFSGKASLRVRLDSRIQRPKDSEMEGAFQAWADPDQQPESVTYPLVFDAPDFRRHDSLALPISVPVQLAAFAHELSCYDSPEAFAADQTGIRYAPKSFIPSGMFLAEGESAGPPRSQAIFTGIILETGKRINQLTGESFDWILVDSLDGSFDVVADPQLINHDLQVGGVVYGSFWLSGLIEGA